MLKSKNKLVGRLKQKSTLKGKLNNAIKYEYPPLDDLEVTPSSEEQVFTHENSYGYDRVVVHKTLGDPREYFSRVSSSKNGTTAQQGAWAFTIEKLPPLNFSGTNFHTMYAYFNGTEIDVSQLDTSNVTSMYAMFMRCENLINIIGIEDFNTKNVTNMYQMFYYCGKLKELDLSKWDVSNVRQFGSMFRECNKLETLNISGFKFTNAMTNSTNTSTYVFSGCRNLTNIIGTENLVDDHMTDISYMFNQCNNLKHVDISGWDTSNVANMSGLFYGTALEGTLDMSHLNLSNVTNISSLFSQVDTITGVVFPKTAATKITTISDLFRACRLIKSIDLSWIHTSDKITMGQTFDGCTSLGYLDMRNISLDLATPNSYMFRNVPTNCEIIVKDDASKAWVLARRSDFTNVKTVAELEAA